ncbi:beta-glucosidase [Listeria valentina]|uniref:beta-glucosidase n=1 Tax=Listeria valentina TaxID=2705293 RepID=UPI0014315220|nr:glycoside hydrolase family 3 protein [Listeria valentina]
MEKKDIELAVEEIVMNLSVSDKAKLLSQIIWETTNVKNIHPLLSQFLLADGPSGLRRLKEYFDEDIYNTKPSTCYPSVSTYASSWDRELVKKIGKHIAKEALQEEVDTLLAPAVNIKRSPLGGRNFEYYSEDPYLTSELATEFIHGLQDEGIGACLKHFAVNNQETRRMNINAVVDETALHEIYLRAFEKPIKVAKPKMVMTAYNKVNGEFCASNQTLLTILREKWGYEGVVVTDCFAAHDLAESISYGLTLQMPGEQENQIVNQIDQLIQNKQLTEEQLTKAVKYNLYFSLEAESNRYRRKRYDRDDHHLFAQRVAEESMILLKNQEQSLPVQQSDSVLVVGELAIKPHFQGGGSSHVNPYKLEIPLEKIYEHSKNVEFMMGYRIEQKEQNSLLKKELLDKAKNFEKIIVFAGLHELSESEGYDRLSLSLPPEQNELIYELSKIHPCVIVVLSNGSVVEMPWRNEVQAILEGYLGGEAGGAALARILYGEVSPSGKLAETFPLNLRDTPSFLSFPGGKKEVVYQEGVFVGYKFYDALRKEVAFPFGHGLSYTTFSYRMADDDFINPQKSSVKLYIKNSGEMAGKEVIQIYVQRKDRQTSIMPKKLVGFEKVMLNKGEEKQIEIELDKKTWMHYDADTHMWKELNGEWELSVGSSVEDIRLSRIVNIDTEPIAITEDSNIGDIVRIAGKYEQMEKLLQNHPKSLGFLEMTKEKDPLKAISMGSLMTFNTLKRADETLGEKEIKQIIKKMNLEVKEENH